MRKGLMLLLMFSLPALVGYAQYDDMYFVPTRASKQAKQKPAKTPDNVQHNVVEDTPDEVYNNPNPTRDVDEYNRRGSAYASDEDNVQPSTQPDTVADGYACSKRILRFCTPTVGVAVSSPLYWDLCYGPYSIYYDVYDDGTYAYVYPGSWGMSWSWSWGWPYYGWHSPYYWGWHGAPYWGWYGSPYYHSWHHGWYHDWHHDWHHAPSRPALNRPSTYYRQTSPLARGSRATTNRLSTGASTRGLSGNRSALSSRSTGVLRSGTSTSTRTSPARGSSSRSTRDASAGTVRNRLSSGSSGSTSTPSSRSTYSAPSRSSYGSPSRSSSFSSPSRSSSFSSPARSGGSTVSRSRR